MAKRIGIIGTGRSVGIAGNHLQGIQAVPDWELTAIFDINPDNAHHFMEKNKLTTPVLCDSLEQLFERVDAVAVCTDNSSHAELVRASVHRSIPVLCEKPLTRNYRESKALANEVRAAGAIGYMGMQYRYTPYAQVIKEIADSGELGEVYYYRQKIGGSRIGNEHVPLEWRMQKELSGPGSLIDFGVHQVDLYYFFLQQLCGDITDVQSELVTVVKEREKLNRSGKGKVTNDDIAAVIARTQNGALINLSNSRVVPLDGSGLEIVGTKAAVYMDEKGAVYLRRKKENGSWNEERTPVPAMERHKFPGQARGRQYREFYDIIVHGIPYELDFDYGAKAVRVIDAAVLSSETGRRISVAEII